MNKRRNLETLVTDAKKRAESFERQVSVFDDVLFFVIVLHIST